MDKVSLLKIAKVADPIQRECLKVIERGTSDLNSSEKIATIILMLDIMKRSLTSVVSEEDIKLFENRIRNHIEMGSFLND